MSEIKLQQAFRVDIIESERGWGQKLDEVKYFDNAQEAQDFCNKFNRMNTQKTAPDWYMQANYVGKV